MKLTLCKHQLPEMSEGLVLLRSLGIGRKKGEGVVFSGPFFLFWGPKMFSLRDWCISHAKEDCISPVQRAGYTFFKSKLQSMFFYKYSTHALSFFMTCDPSSPESQPGSMSWIHRKRVREVAFSLHSQIVCCGKFMLQLNFKVWKSESVQFQGSMTLCVCVSLTEYLTYGGEVNCNLPLNKGINLGIDLLSVEKHCRLKYIKDFAVMLLTWREK